MAYPVHYQRVSEPSEMRAKMAKRQLACVCFLSVAWTAACDGSGDSGGSGGSGGSTGDDCSTTVTCFAGVTMSGTCPDSVMPTAVWDEDSARCVLEHLRDGKVGLVGIALEGMIDFAGDCGVRHDIHVVEDREAIVVSNEHIDVGEVISTRSAALKPADEYQTCLDDGPAAYPSCLADAVVFQGEDPACECDYCMN